MTDKTQPKAYFFISRPVEIQIANEGISCIIAESVEDATLHAVKVIPPGFKLKFVAARTRQEMYDVFKDCFEKAGAQSKKKEKVAEPIAQLPTVAPTDPITLKKDEFRNSILLAADDFIKNKKDRETLKEIIKKAKL